MPTRLRVRQWLKLGGRHSSRAWGNKSKKELNGDVRKSVEDLPERKAGQRKAQPTVEKEVEVVEDEDLEEGEDEEDDADVEYIVEAIVGHKWIKGKLVYNTKWQGYGEDENTYEPEDNLIPGAKELLAAYHASIGGAPPKNSTNSKKRKSTTSLRESLPTSTKSDSQTSDAPAASNTKKPRKPQPNDSSISATEYGYQPSSKNWSPEVQKIDTIERDAENHKLYAYVRWTNGQRTKVGMDKIYKHCPIPMLHFYEDHLKFN